MKERQAVLLGAKPLLPRAGASCQLAYVAGSLRASLIML
jgi:hypothetical protein